MSPAAEHDAVVLAGGAARRLGGVSKPDVVVGGRRLLDHVLAATSAARRVVVVGPERLARPGILRTSEDPPFGGPVAGLVAGLAALDQAAQQAGQRQAPWTLVLACDVPLAADVVPRLLATATDGQDGAQAVDATGRAQPLLAVYRRAALDRAVTALRAQSGVRDAAVRHLVRHLDLQDVPDEGSGADVDTWHDVDRVQEHLKEGR